MAFDPHKNFAYSTVATAPSPATSGTSLTVATGDGSKFPNPSTDGAFNVTIWPTGAQPTVANAEIARCTARSGDVLTITRAQESTSARTVVVGDQISLTITAKLLKDIENALLSSVLTTKGDILGYDTAPDRVPVGTDGLFLKADSTQALGVKWDSPTAAASPGGLAIYGDGSDGSLHFDGTTTILGLAPSGSVYTLTRDIFASAITIDSGVSIVTNGFRVFCSGTLTNNGTIQWDGNNATSTTGALAQNNSVSSLNAGSASSNEPGAPGGSGTTTTGNGGTSLSAQGLGGAGGHGGQAVANNGGSGGAAVSAAAKFSIRFSSPAIAGAFIQAGSNQAVCQGGSGGGGGGGDGTNAGGGGGGGGAIVVVVAKTIAGTGAIHARGGTGFSPTVGNVGGGGGGGGGVVIVVSSSVVSGAVAGQTIDANGGAHGSAHGTGTNSGVTDGSPGTVILLPN